MDVENQYREWATARVEFDNLFKRLRTYNLKEQCARLFGQNLLVCYPLIPQSSLGGNPELAANVIGIFNSQLPELGAHVVEAILLEAKKQLGKFGGKLKSPQSLFVCSHLLVLEVIDVYPMFQLLFCLCKEKKWAVAAQIMQICGSTLKRASLQSHDYIKAQIGDYKSRKCLDIIPDSRKTRHKFDLERLQAHPAKFDLCSDWTVKQRQWTEIKASIIGEEESEDEGQEEEQYEQADELETQVQGQAPIDQNANVKALRKTIYLTIMSSLSSKEAVHKLLALGNREQVVKMLLETLKQERIYNKTFGSIGQALCGAGSQWRHSLAASFNDVYSNAEDLSTKELRHLGTFFGYLVATEAIDRQVFQVVILPESTPSTRILLQSLFEEMRRELGMQGLKALEGCEDAKGMFPRGDAKALRFCINFFTAIKMGPLTEEMRVRLKQAT